MSREPDLAQGVFRGHEGLRRYYREWGDAWESLAEEYDELTDAGDQVVSSGRWHLRGRTSGIEVTGPTTTGVWTIRDRKVVRVVWYESRDEALAAAGILE